MTRAAASRLLAASALLVACKSKSPTPHRDDASTARPVGDASAPIDAAVWRELAELPRVEPVRVIALPAKPDVPRFDLGGPVLVGDLALVSSSQFGFIAADFRRGQIAWSKPAGLHVAPPVVIDGNPVLIGDCQNPPEVPAGETLLGCMRVVTPTGTDQAYLAIHGKGVTDFTTADGEQRVWATGKSALVWKRGEHAVAIDMMSGVAKTTPAVEPPLIVTYKGKSWEIRQTEDGLIDAKGTPAWRTERSYGALLGAIYIPDLAPMVRAAGVTVHGGSPEIMLFDTDATGSLHGQVTLNPVPGVSIMAHAISKVGNTALAVRLDRSLERDFIAGYAANASLQWTYPLPQHARPDAVGLAIAPDAVVVFHDGDTLTILPELSAPPTAPGAVRDPLENPTP